MASPHSLLQPPPLLPGAPASILPPYAEADVWGCPISSATVRETNFAGPRQKSPGTRRETWGNPERKGKSRARGWRWGTPLLALGARWSSAAGAKSRPWQGQETLLLSAHPSPRSPEAPSCPLGNRGSLPCLSQGKSLGCGLQSVCLPPPRYLLGCENSMVGK